MKFKIESKFVNDYLYSQSQKKKEIQNRKRKMRIETEIENGFSKMFSDKIKEYDNQKGGRRMSVNIETQDYIKQKEIQRQRQNQNNNNNDFVTYTIAAIIVFFIYAILFN